MRQKFLIVLALISLLVILIGLNAASYVQKEKIPDTEEVPNRSTYNTGATGTRAFYELLVETGRKVKRFEEPFRTDGIFDAAEFSTFVIIGRTRREIKEEEIRHILDWVSNGGTFVVIDREPPRELIPQASNWKVSQEVSENVIVNIDPSDRKQMIGETEAVKPILPTVLTRNLNAVQPSQFASSIKISRLNAPKSQDEKSVKDSNVYEKNTPRSAPVIHIAGEKTNLLVDLPLGAGQIIYLSDPYIVSNGGINLVDNAQLGINIVDSRGGIIAFDEYHQGFGNNENRLLAYFSGTPVIAIFLQIFLIIAFVFYSQSRRFARALPDREPDRLSKLEYVSAMAQLQQQTKAYDLAVENIYGEFRRRISRFVGVDNKTTSRENLAKKIAERTKYDAKELEDLFYKCEDIMHGEPTSKKEIINLTSRLREIEADLGLRRSIERTRE